MKTKNEDQRETLKSPFFYAYVITDPEHYGNTPFEFEKNLRQVLSTHSIDMICFRDKQTQDIESLAQVFIQVVREFQIEKALINNNIQIALKMGFDGVHLTSQQYDLIQECRQLNLYTIVSAHSKKDVEYIKTQKADAITFSPIFFKENKGDPKGCEELRQIVNQYQDNSFDIFALGGITSVENVEKVQQTNCKGFASIGYFKKPLN